MNVYFANRQSVAIKRSTIGAIRFVESKRFGRSVVPGLWLRRQGHGELEHSTPPSFFYELFVEQGAQHQMFRGFCQIKMFFSVETCVYPRIVEGYRRLSCFSRGRFFRFEINSSQDAAGHIKTAQLANRKGGGRVACLIYHNSKRMYVDAVGTESWSRKHCTTFHATC